MKKNTRSAWAWIPSLYFAEGLPYVVVMTVSVIMYKRLEVSNTDIALYTSWLYLPWVIKPFWSPVVDLLKTKRWWIVVMQLIIGAALAGVAITLPAPNFLKYTLLFFWLMAFSSATHDIAADGFYMLALDENKQAFFVGIRSTFYRLAMIAGQGLLVILAGHLELTTGNIAFAWSVTFWVLAALFVCFFLYHKFIFPRPAGDIATNEKKDIVAEFFRTFISFVKKDKVGIAILFFLVYRLGESQLVKLASPFLLDNKEIGGLGLSTTQVGFIYGTIGVVCLTVGGILGGLLASLNGLKHWIWWMVIAINLPNLVYVYLSFFVPDSVVLISVCIGIEQFGYGFGFTAFMLYMIYFAEGKNKTAHFAFCTGIMALGMMLPGMVSGWIQEIVGYKNFFIWVMLCTIPSFVVVRFLKIDANFGKKKK